jgi:hypothetical protein
VKIYRNVTIFTGMTMLEVLLYGALETIEPGAGNQHGTKELKARQAELS